LFPDRFAYIPVASTDLSVISRPAGTVLTAAAIAELISDFQAMGLARRAKHASQCQRQRLGSTARQRTRRDRRGHLAQPHGGGGQGGVARRAKPGTENARGWSMSANPIPNKC